MQNWRYSYFGIWLKVAEQEPLNFPHYYSSSPYWPLGGAAWALFLKVAALKREPNFSPWSTGDCASKLCFWDCSRSVSFQVFGSTVRAHCKCCGGGRGQKKRNLKNNLQEGAGRGARSRVYVHLEAAHWPVGGPRTPLWKPWRPSLPLLKAGVQEVTGAAGKSLRLLLHEWNRVQTVWGVRIVRNKPGRCVGWKGR